MAENMLSSILILLCIAMVATYLVVCSPHSKCTRLKLKGSNPITIPKICVITGEPSTEEHTVLSFYGNPWFIEKFSLPLPFSEAGWLQYRRNLPLSVRFLKSGFNILMYIPLLGGYLSIYLWFIFSFPIWGALAIVDLITGKRPLVKLHWLNVSWGESEIKGIDISVLSSSFADELIKADAELTIPYKDWYEFWK